MGAKCYHKPMPKFLYTIIVLALLLWYLLVVFMDSNAPDSYSKILFALGVFMAAFSLTLSMVFFHIKSKKRPLQDKRKAYRDSLKLGVLVSGFVTFFLVVKTLMIK